MSASCAGNKSGDHVIIMSRFAAAVREKNIQSISLTLNIVHFTSVSECVSVCETCGRLDQCCGLTAGWASVGLDVLHLYPVRSVLTRSGPELLFPSWAWACISKAFFSPSPRCFIHPQSPVNLPIGRTANPRISFNSRQSHSQFDVRTVPSLPLSHPLPPCVSHTCITKWLTGSHTFIFMLTLETHPQPNNVSSIPLTSHCR